MRAIKIFSTYIILFTVWASFIAAPAKANSEPEEIHRSAANLITGDQVSERAIVNAFLQAAINRHAFSDNPFPNFVDLGNVSTPSFTSSQARFVVPWLLDYFSTAGSDSNPFAISKRKDNIRIAVGFPDYPEHNFEDLPNQKFEEINEAATRTLHQAISEITPEIEEATGLDVESYQTNSKGLFSKPNLRIVLVNSGSSSSWMTKYKKGPVTSTGGGFSAIMRTETRLPNKIEFTPLWGLYQVSGYNLLDSSNNIIYSTCYIRDDREPDILQNLVRECIVRSMGFPSIQNGLPDSVLGLWNPPAMSEQDVKVAANALVESVGMEQATEWVIYNVGAALPSMRRKVGKVPDSGLSEADKLLLRLMYSSNLHSGDGPLKVRDELEKLLNAGDIK